VMFYDVLVGPTHGYLCQRSGYHKLSKKKRISPSNIYIKKQKTLASSQYGTQDIRIQTDCRWLQNQSLFMRKGYISNSIHVIARKETYSSNITNSFILARSNEAVALAFLEVQ
jgi:hypothetical protein